MLRLAPCLHLFLVTASLALAGCGSSPEAPPPPAPEEIAYIASAPGVDRVQLHRAIDPLFTDEAMADTRAVIVMHRGDIVAERYGEGYGPKTRFLGWSMSKSVTAVLVGVMVSDGRLALDRPAPVPAWQRPGDPRGAITLRQLLQMASGLTHSEAIDPIYQADEVRMLFLDGHDDMAAYAEAQPLEAAPGSQFEYSTATSVILADIITNALTRSQDPAIRQRAMQDFMTGRLLVPVGLESMDGEYDAQGTLIGGSLIHANARDWAQFGNFLRNKGSVAGNQVVPRAWFDFMRTPSTDEPAYGGHIWLNNVRPGGRDAVLFPGRAPANVFACLGHLGQYIIVAPDAGLVVVRLGKTQDDTLGNVREQLGSIVALYN